MAFDRANLSLLEYANGFGIWHYTSLSDDIATCSSVGYFQGIGTNLMRRGNLLLIDASDGSCWRRIQHNDGRAAHLGLLKAEAAATIEPGSLTLAHIADAGSAAAAEASDFATAAQGIRADEAVQPGQLAPVATSGSFDDLLDKPSAVELGGAPAAHVHDIDEVTGLRAALDAKLAAGGQIDLEGGGITNHLAQQDEVAGAYTFLQADSGREKVFTGASPATWTVPALAAGTHAVVHNVGAAAITFAASGVALKGLTVLEADKTTAVSWLPRGIVKLTGELT